MLSTASLTLLRISRRLWVRAAMISVLAVAAALIAPFAARLLPALLTDTLTADDLQALLSSLTFSMLTVTTFSLSVMVTTHLHADTTASPRSHRLLREDTRTQTVLATFIGAFVFGLTAQILLDTGMIHSEQIAVVYFVAIAVYGLIVVAILRWIAHLSRLGSVEETIDRVEERARQAIRIRMRAPHLGGHPLPVPARIPDGTHSVLAARFGFVQHIDTVKLSGIADRLGGSLYLTVQPGDWVNAGEPVAEAACEDFDDAAEAALSDCIRLGDVRTFEQDTAFGVIVLTEVAQRALSPSVNDPRTALDIIARQVRLCSELLREDSRAEMDAPNVYAPPLNIGLVIEEAFDPIARDGKAFVEVQKHIQTAMRVLSGHRNPEVAQGARIVARRGLAYAGAGLLLREDMDRVRAAGPDAGVEPAPLLEPATPVRIAAR